jgi:pectinesterase
MNRFICISIVAIAISGPAQAAENKAAQGQYVPLPDISVALDGTGQFKSINEALKSIPKGNRQRIVIYIKNGIYKEHIRIDANCVTLVGQSRDKTRIEYTLSAFSPDANDKTFGRGTLSYYADDIIIQDMTIHNTVEEVGPHAFAVFGRGDRFILQNCDVLSNGADTIASWKFKAMGMYYYANLKVTGCVDFVCPRGWCYMKNSTLYELKNTAALWQQGVNDPNKKFVLKNCRIDGVEGFVLGRHHYDAAFYLLDCTFGKTMKDSPLARTKGDQTLQFGEDRHYYYNCHRDGGDYAWFKDNLEKAASSPKPEDITPAWTFGGKWDPESSVAPAVASVIASGGNIAVTFSDAVTVKGQPSVILTDGTAVIYKSGSGTATLIFALPSGSTSAAKSLDLSKGAILACKASAKPRFVTKTSL